MERLRNVVREWDYVRLFPKGDQDLAQTFGCDFEMFDSSVLFRVFKIEGNKFGLARAELFADGSEEIDYSLFGIRLCKVYWDIIKPLSAEMYLAVEKISEEVDGVRVKGIKELYVFTGDGSCEFPYEVWL